MNREEMLAHKSTLEAQLRSLDQALDSTYESLNEQFKTADKKTREQLVWQLPELSYNSYSMLQDMGFKTGSSVYATVPPADEDWVINVPPAAFGQYVLGVGEGYEYNDMSVLYAHYKGVILNILCMHQEDYYIWAETTHILRDMNKLSVKLKNRFDVKWARVMVFRAIKDALKPPVSRKETSYYMDSIQFKKCANCGREAENFISQEYETLYLVDGICDRCRTELCLGAQI